MWVGWRITPDSKTHARQYKDFWSLGITQHCGGESMSDKLCDNSSPALIHARRFAFPRGCKFAQDNDRPFPSSNRSFHNYRGKHQHTILADFRNNRRTRANNLVFDAHSKVIQTSTRQSKVTRHPVLVFYNSHIDRACPYYFILPRVVFLPLKTGPPRHPRRQGSAASTP